jgi:NAD(P)-dependent dehydrogenase (short-subunit alcohol dehydrogenase family)
MDVNFEAPYTLCKLYSGYLIRRKIAASIINVGSVVGSSGNDAQASYAASKSALIGA